MTISLSDLRVFARETASHDVSGAAAGREVMYWINSALARIWSAHPWVWAQSSARVTLNRQEAGTGLTTVDGARQFTFTSQPLDKYVADRWHLHVDGEDSFTFEPESINGLVVTMLTGHEWVEEAGSGVDYFWRRHIYPLPDDAKEITRLRVAQDGNLVDVVLPHKFDAVRQQTPTQSGDAPTLATIRKGFLEVWPAPGSSHKTLEFTYRRKPPRYTADQDDDTVVDWPEEWIDLLQKGIVLEASKTQGKNAPVAIGAAEVDFLSRLNAYKGEDSGIANLNGPMGGRVMIDPFQLTGYPSSIPDAT